MSFTALVTGGSGLIGSAVVRALLDRGATVRLTDIAPPPEPFPPGRAPEVIPADMYTWGEHPELVDGVDVIFHLAHDFTDQWGQHQLLNIPPAEALAAHARRAGVKHFVLASSSTVYGAPRSEVVDESHPTNAATSSYAPYAEVKLEIERVCARALGSVPLTILRPSFVVDVAARRLRSMARRMFGPVMSGETEVSSRLRYSVTRCDDAAQVFVLAALNPATYGEAFNVCGAAVRIVELAGELALRSGVPNRTVVTEGSFVPETIDQVRLDASKARRVLGFEPLFTETELLEALLAHWSSGALDER